LSKHTFLVSVKYDLREVLFSYPLRCVADYDSADIVFVMHHHD